VYMCVLRIGLSMYMSVLGYVFVCIEGLFGSVYECKKVY